MRRPSELRLLSQAPAPMVVDQEYDYYGHIRDGTLVVATREIPNAPPLGKRYAKFHLAGADWYALVPDIRRGCKRPDLMVSEARAVEILRSAPPIMRKKIVRVGRTGLYNIPVLVPCAPSRLRSSKNTSPELRQLRSRAVGLLKERVRELSLDQLRQFVEGPDDA